MDASISYLGIGSLKEPFTCTIEKGFITNISGGGEQVKILQDAITVHDDPNCWNITELGVGLNPSASMAGRMLEDGGCSTQYISASARPHARRITQGGYPLRSHHVGPGHRNRWGDSLAWSRYSLLTERMPNEGYSYSEGHHQPQLVHGRQSLLICLVGAPHGGEKDILKLARKRARLAISNGDAVH